MLHRAASDTYHSSLFTMLGDPGMAMLLLLLLLLRPRRESGGDKGYINERKDSKKSKLQVSAELAHLKAFIAAGI